MTVEDFIANWKQSTKLFLQIPDIDSTSLPMKSSARLQNGRMDKLLKELVLLIFRFHRYLLEKAADFNKISPEIKFKIQNNLPNQKPHNQTNCN